MKIAGIKLEDAGEKNEPPPTLQRKSSKQPTVNFPRVESWQGDMPGAKELESDKEYLMVAKTRCTRKEIVDEGGKKTHRVGLDILAWGFQPFSEKSVDKKSADELTKEMREISDDIEDE